MRVRTDVDLGAVERALAGTGMTVRSGVDLVELAVFRRVLATGGEEFLATVYTETEREHCAGRVERLAARFAAKEAASKALGTGLRGVGPFEIEVVSEENGEPRLVLHGRARDRARLLGVISMSVSLTHAAAVAEAFVVALAAQDVTDEPVRKECTL